MRQNPDFITRRIAGELLLVPIAHDAASLQGVLTFNEVGGRVWELLQECDSEEQIARRLTDEYDVTLAQALEDVSELVGQLRQLNAVIDD